MVGEYRGGERLNADRIAAALGVSRQPVFDSFKRLSTEGFLVVRPNVSCTVATYEIDQIRDFFEIFAAVEGTAAAMAASRRTDQEVVDLRRLHAQIGGLTALDNAEERAQGYRALNREFHSMIHAMTRSTMVETTGSGMYDRADFFINGTPPRSPFADNLPARQADHARILAALENADPDAARQTIFDHIVGTVKLIELTVETAAA